MAKYLSSEDACNVQISEEVITAIVAIAACDVEGVVPAGAKNSNIDWKDLLPKKGFGKNVRVESPEGQAGDRRGHLGGIRQTHPAGFGERAESGVRRGHEPDGAQSRQCQCARERDSVPEKEAGITLAERNRPRFCMAGFSVNVNRIKISPSRRREGFIFLLVYSIMFKI